MLRSEVKSLHADMDARANYEAGLQCDLVSGL